MALPQPERSEQHPRDGRKPQLSLVHTHSEASDDAVWFTACAWCSRIRMGGHWIEALAALKSLRERPGPTPQLSLGICPTCFCEISRRAADERGQSASATNSL
jgi:hypothetical protein